jgi:cohesin complex subunit SA-1/2
MFPPSLSRKAHMDQALELAKVEILPNLKLWEPQRAYEKRLSTIMAKENRRFF